MPELDIKALRPGDPVGVSFGGIRPAGDIRPVAKVTPGGQIALDNGDRYTATGYKIGQAAHYGRSHLVSPERGRELKRRGDLREALRQLHRRAERLAHEHDDGPTPLTADERADLIALVDLCSGAVPDAGSDEAE